MRLFSRKPIIDRHARLKTRTPLRLELLEDRSLPSAVSLSAAAGTYLSGGLHDGVFFTKPNDNNLYYTPQLKSGNGASLPPMPLGSVGSPIVQISAAEDNAGRVAAFFRDQNNAVWEWMSSTGLITSSPIATGMTNISACVAVGPNAGPGTNTGNTCFMMDNNNVYIYQVGMTTRLLLNVQPTAISAAYEWAGDPGQPTFYASFFVLYGQTLDYYTQNQTTGLWNPASLVGTNVACMSASQTIGHFLTSDGGDAGPTNNGTVVFANTSGYVYVSNELVNTVVNPTAPLTGIMDVSAGFTRIGGPHGDRLSYVTPFVLLTNYNLIQYQKNIGSGYTNVSYTSAISDLSASQTWVNTVFVETTADDLDFYNMGPSNRLDAD